MGNLGGKSWVKLGEKSWGNPQKLRFIAGKSMKSMVDAPRYLREIKICDEHGCPST